MTAADSYTHCVSQAGIVTHICDQSTPNLLHSLTELECVSYSCLEVIQCGFGIHQFINRASCQMSLFSFDCFVRPYNKSYFGAGGSGILAMVICTSGNYPGLLYLIAQQQVGSFEQLTVFDGRAFLLSSGRQ